MGFWTGPIENRRLRMLEPSNPIAPIELRLRILPHRGVYLIAARLSTRRINCTSSSHPPPSTQANDVVSLPSASIAACDSTLVWPSFALSIHDSSPDYSWILVHPISSRRPRHTFALSNRVSFLRTTWRITGVLARTHRQTHSRQRPRSLSKAAPPPLASRLLQHHTPLCSLPHPFLNACS
jgi:hypothetical protein